MDNLPVSHVQLLLDASAWIGIPESERTQTQKTLLDRSVALEAVGRGAPVSVAAKKDEALRAAVDALYLRVATDCRIPGRDEALLAYMVSMLCSGPDAATAERSLASRTAAEAVSRIQSGGFEGKYLVRITIAVLWGLRRVLAEDDGNLSYKNVLSLHRAVKAVFATPDLVQNVRRARLTALASRGTMEFDVLWEMIRLHEGR